MMRMAALLSAVLLVMTLNACLKKDEAEPTMEPETTVSTQTEPETTEYETEPEETEPEETEPETEIESTEEAQAQADEVTFQADTDDWKEAYPAFMKKFAADQTLGADGKLSYTFFQMEGFEAPILILRTEGDFYYFYSFESGTVRWQTTTGMLNGEIRQHGKKLYTFRVNGAPAHEIYEEIFGTDGEIRDEEIARWAHFSVLEGEEDVFLGREDAPIHKSEFLAIERRIGLYEKLTFKECE